MHLLLLTNCQSALKFWQNIQKTVSCRSERDSLELLHFMRCIFPLRVSSRKEGDARIPGFWVEYKLWLSWVQPNTSASQVRQCPLLQNAVDDPEPAATISAHHNMTLQLFILSEISGFMAYPLRTRPQLTASSMSTVTASTWRPHYFVAICIFVAMGFQSCTATILTIDRFEAADFS